MWIKLKDSTKTVWIEIVLSLCNTISSISMGKCKKDVTPSLTHWSYVFLALTHRYYAYHPPTKYDDAMTKGRLATLRWRHNGREIVSNHQPYDRLLNRLFRRRSKKTSKLGVTGLCAGNSPVTGEFPAHMASNADNVSIWWRRHELLALFDGNQLDPGGFASQRGWRCKAFIYSLLLAWASCRTNNQVVVDLRCYDAHATPL